MNELERLDQIEKQVKAKKRETRETLKKGYEILGRGFYKQSNAKSMPEAFDMLTKPQTPTVTEEQLINLKSQEEKLINLKSQLQVIANGLEWTGNYWHAENLKEVTQWLSQFRKENNQ